MYLENSIVLDRFSSQTENVRYIGLDKRPDNSELGQTVQNKQLSIQGPSLHHECWRKVHPQICQEIL